MVSRKSTRLRWAKKILGAKYFVVLTDNESVIALEGVDPHNLHDIVALQEQSASIDNFMYMLKDLKQEHDEIIARKTEGSKGETRKKKVSINKRKKTSTKEV